MPGLFGSEILDTGLGLVLVYLLVALIASVINEWIAQLLSLRAQTLEDGLRNMLNDPQSTEEKLRDLTQTLYDHPLISGMSPIRTRAADAKFIEDNSPPNYIAPRAFAQALLDIVMPPGPTSTNVAVLRDTVSKIQNEPVRTVLLRLIDETDGDIVQIRQGLEQWFNDTMERVSGWYRRKLRIITLTVALVLTVLVNGDSVLIVRTLWASPAERAAVTATAADVLRALPTPTVPTTLKEQEAAIDTAISELGTSQLPLTWSTDPKDQRALPWLWAGDRSDPIGVVHWFSRVIGLLLTTLGVSLGAPFWFDVLNKFMGFRATGTPPKAGASTTNG